MSTPKKQLKLKPTPPTAKTANEEQVLEQEYERVFKKHQIELTHEGMKPYPPEPCPTIESKLIEQLEECVSVLLDLISIGGGGSIENSLKPLTQRPVTPAILTSYHTIKQNNTTTTTLQEGIPLIPIVQQKPSEKP